MTAKEMTAHIRSRVKQAGISAGVRKYESCGFTWIQVYAKLNKGEKFSDEDQRQINLIAKVNGLTGSRGSEIEIETPFGDQADFVFNA